MISSKSKDQGDIVLNNGGACKNDPCYFSHNISQYPCLALNHIPSPSYITLINSLLVREVGSDSLPKKLPKSTSEIQLEKQNFGKKDDFDLNFELTTPLPLFSHSLNKNSSDDSIHDDFFDDFFIFDENENINNKNVNFSNFSNFDSTKYRQIHSISRNDVLRRASECIFQNPRLNIADLGLDCSVTCRYALEVLNEKIPTKMTTKNDQNCITSGQTSQKCPFSHRKLSDKEVKYEILWYAWLDEKYHQEKFLNKKGKKFFAELKLSYFEAMKRVYES
jgi:hypothetical protein